MTQNKRSKKDITELKLKSSSNFDRKSALKIMGTIVEIFGTQFS